MRKKRTPWPRWAMILRNILLTVLLGLMMWDAWGCPSLSFRADLRRRERQMLLPKPEAAIDLELFYGNPFRVELAENKVVMSHATRGSFFTVAYPSIYTLREGPDLLSIPYTICMRDEAGQRQERVVYIAFHPPAGTARAVLTLHSKDGDLTAEGVQEENIFLFYIDSERALLANTIQSIPEEYTWALTFYDENGSELQEPSGQPKART